MKKSVILFSAVLLGILCCVAGFCQYGGGMSQGNIPQGNSLTGTVVDIDWVASLLTIRYFDTLRNSYDEITFTVPSDAKIVKGTDAIDFSDIEEGDEVVIEYSRNDFSGLKAKSIIDENMANK